MNKIVSIDDLIIQLEQDLRGLRERLNDAEFMIIKLKEKLREEQGEKSVLKNQINKFIHGECHGETLHYPEER